MTPEVIAISIAIFFARVIDVSLGTLRTMTVVRGRRRTAFVLGFFEVLIWVFAVARVVDNLSNPVVAIAYALGFATGSVVGMTLERFLSMGQRVVRIFSHEGAKIAEALRAAGFTVAEFEGRRSGGALTLLYVEVPKKKPDAVLKIVHAIDPTCFYVVEEVRVSPTALGTNVPRTGWLATMRRK